MTPRQRTLTAAVAALGALSARGSEPAGPSGSSTGPATTAVNGLANGTATPKTSCELERAA
ncbi:hypothetical protein [Streptomyces sp. NPDC057552]|uniref:hypothetical protein n=1 Tax=Streptomyces sp. NPDC057552 TaxID=3350537 RepID=UPI0036AABA34